MSGGMIRATIDVTIAREALALDAGYARLCALVASLAAVHPSLRAWYALADTRNGPAIPLQDKAAFLADVLAEQTGMDAQDRGFCAMLSTAPDDRAWLRPGRALLSFAPNQGYLTYEVYDPIAAHGAAGTTELFKRALRAIAQSQPVLFAATDVNARLRSGKGVTMYAGEHQLFAHRRWLGWMGVVPQPVEPRHLPEAAAVLPLGRHGTLIVAVDACFDLHDPEHLRRAHSVEARMAHIGLLDVVDDALR